MRIRRRAGAVALAAWCFVAHTATPAQVVDDVTGVPPFQWGPVLFFPVVSAQVEYTGNLYYTPDVIAAQDDREKIATSTTSVNPSLLFVLPFHESRVRAGYAYRYSDYATKDIPANDAHYFMTDAALKFSSGWLVELRDDFQKGVLDTEVFDPGGAITFSGQSFRSNTASAAVGYRGPRYTVRLAGATDVINFPEDRIAAYFDTNGWSASLTFEFLLSNRVGLAGTYNSRRTRLVRPILPTNLVDRRIEIATGTDLGADIQLAPESSLAVRVGNPAWQFDAFNFAPEKFRSIVGSAQYDQAIPAGAQLSVALGRNLYPAVFLDTNHYVDERLHMSISNDLQARLVLGASVSYYFNRYPSTELLRPEAFRRVDESYDVTGTIGYRVAEHMEWRVFVRLENRDSNAPEFSYRTGTIGASFTLGGS